MSSVTITFNVTGAADDEDRRAMLHVIGIENARRAALTPPLDPLPSSNAVERRTSYETIMSPRLMAAHLANIADSTVATLADVRARWRYATDAQRNAVLAALPPLP